MNCEHILFLVLPAFLNALTDRNSIIQTRISAQSPPARLIPPGHRHRSNARRGKFKLRLSCCFNNDARA
jgi:hypothetical protein